MASEPSDATTMSDLVLRVAEKLGIAEYTSAGLIHVPTDQFNFNLCKRYVNNGIRMFMADAPRKGWRWMRRICSVTFAVRVIGTADVGTGANNLVDLTLAGTYKTVDVLKNWWAYILTGTGVGSYAQITGYNQTTGNCAIAGGWLGGANPVATDTFAITSVETVAGDTSRYNLPADFSGTVDGKIKYAANSSTGVRIEWCDEATIRAQRSISVNSGTPRLAAIRPYQPIDENLSSTRLWEMIIDPQSIAALTVEFPYTLHFDKMDIESGTADGTYGATTFADSVARKDNEANDYFNGWIIRIIAGSGVGEYAIVDDFVRNTGTFLFNAGLSGGTVPTATTKYIVEPVANLHPAGHQFDDAIESACLARTEMESQDEHFDSFWTDLYHKKAIPNAYRLDQRSAPRTLGPMTNGPTIRGGRLGDSFTCTRYSDGSSLIRP